MKKCSQKRPITVSSTDIIDLDSEDDIEISPMESDISVKSSLQSPTIAESAPSTSTSRLFPYQKISVSPLRISQDSISQNPDEFLNIRLSPQLDMSKSVQCSLEKNIQIHNVKKDTTERSFKSVEIQTNFDVGQICYYPPLGLITPPSDLRTDVNSPDIDTTPESREFTSQTSDNVSPSSNVSTQSSDVFHSDGDEENKKCEKIFDSMENINSSNNIYSQELNNTGGIEKNKVDNYDDHKAKLQLEKTNTLDNNNVNEGILQLEKNVFESDLEVIKNPSEKAILDSKIKSVNDTGQDAEVAPLRLDVEFDIEQELANDVEQTCDDNVSPNDSLQNNLSCDIGIDDEIYLDQSFEAEESVIQPILNADACHYSNSEISSNIPSVDKAKTADGNLMNTSKPILIETGGNYANIKTGVMKLSIPSKKVNGLRSRLEIKDYQNNYHLETFKSNLKDNISDENVGSTTESKVWNCIKSSSNRYKQFSNSCRQELRIILTKIEERYPSLRKSLKKARERHKSVKLQPIDCVKRFEESEFESILSGPVGNVDPSSQYYYNPCDVNFDLFSFANSCTDFKSNLRHLSENLRPDSPVCSPKFEAIDTNEFRRHLENEKHSKLNDIIQQEQTHPFYKDSEESTPVKVSVSKRRRIKPNNKNVRFDNVVTLRLIEKDSSPTDESGSELGIERISDFSSGIVKPDVKQVKHNSSSSCILEKIYCSDKRHDENVQMDVNTEDYFNVATNYVPTTRSNLEGMVFTYSYIVNANYNWCVDLSKNVFSFRFSGT